MRNMKETDYVLEDHGYYTPCWTWQLSCKSGTSTPLVYLSEEIKLSAVRWYYEQILKTRIPTGFHLISLCTNLLCVNPEHHKPVTPREAGIIHAHRRDRKLEKETGEFTHYPCTYILKPDGIDMVKIGQTINLPLRLKQLRAANPHSLSVLLRIPGTRHERILHKKFKHLRQHGEWFRLEPDLLDYINNFS